METTSAELLRQFRQGEPGAAEELFQRYVCRLNELVNRQLHRSLRRRMDPEDAVHSAYRSFFLRAKRGDFEIERSGDLWKLLLTITLNKLRRLIARHRSAKRSVSREHGSAGLAEVFATGPSPLEALAAADELESLMARFRPWQRTVIRLRFQDCSLAEIATATGRSDRTIRRILAEVRRIWSVEPAELDQSARPVKKSIPSSESAKIPEHPGHENFLEYDDFLLEEMIGQGGTGKVYRAWWRTCQRRVAVKVLRKPAWTSPEAVSRLITEARTIASLEHPGICRLHGIGRIHGSGIFLVTDLIEGENLARIVARKKPTLGQVVHWMAETADVLDHAHARKIVHCDLKPENLLLDDSGRLVVGDFGFAMNQLTSNEPGSWAGTPGHMAPEQLDRAFGAIGPATDIFAMGLMTIQLATGKRVFEGTRIVTVLSNDPKKSDWWLDADTAGLPAKLTNLLKKCLRIDPAKRLASAAKVRDHLRRMTFDKE